MALDLSKVELPDVEVTIANKTLAAIAVTVIITAIIIMLAGKATKRL